MSLKKYVIAGALLFALNATLSAQNTANQIYYRTFSIELKTLDQETKNSLNALFNQRDSFRLENYCSEGSKVLVSVDASYPKRVDDLISELDSMLTEELGKRKIQSIEQIPFAEKNSYCP